MGYLKRFGALIFLASLTIAAAGCQTVQPVSTPEDNLRAKTLKPLPGMALIYLTRPGEDAKSKEVSILLDDLHVGKMVKGNFIFVEVKAGQHRITAKRSFSKYNLDMTFRDGRKYYLNLTLAEGKYVSEPVLKKLDEEEGKKELEQCTLSLMK